MIIYFVLHIIIMLTITNPVAANYKDLEEVIVQVQTDTNASSVPVPKHPNTIINRLMYLIAMVRCVPSTLNDAEHAV